MIMILIRNEHQFAEEEQRENSLDGADTHKDMDAGDQTIKRF